MRVGKRWKMSISVSKSHRWRPQMSRFVHSPKIFSLLSQRRTETVDNSEARIRVLTFLSGKTQMTTTNRLIIAAPASSERRATTDWFICQFIRWLFPWLSRYIWEKKWTKMASSDVLYCSHPETYSGDCQKGVKDTLKNWKYHSVIKKLTTDHSYVGALSYTTKHVSN